MFKPSIAKIYLSGQRDVESRPGFRCHLLFKGDTRFNEYKTALGDLCRFDDILLAAGKSWLRDAGASAYVILIPLSGSIECVIGASAPGIITAGQLQVFSIHENETYRVRNPSPDKGVNYLELFLAKKPDMPDMIPAPADADLNKFMNVLLQVAAVGSGSGDQWRLSIGKFSGCGETIYQRKYPGKGLFMFVIDGIFEVEGRLLHTRDGLALWDTAEAGVEARSNEALLLVVESNFSGAAP